VGPPETTKKRFSLRLTDHHLRRWVAPLSILEAKKDGVLFRPAEETLDLDALAVLRPRLGAAEIAEALSNAIAHEGKLYNFDFDFFTDDRLVCTEVVYRAYEGVGGISIPLQECFGRRTLPAEDLISMALEGGVFEPVIAFGTPTVGSKIVTDAAAVAALKAIRDAAAAR
jgi:uncharacterized protein YycO